MMETLLTLVAITIIIYLFMKRRRFPDIPGPKGHFLLGNAAQLDSKFPQMTLYRWARQYGALFYINIFCDTIVVNSEEGLREMLITKSEDFAGRPSLFIARSFYPDFGLIFGQYSEEWHHMKRVSMTGLRMVGDGVQRLEDITIEIIEDVVKKMESNEGKPYNYRMILHNAVANITALLTLGHRLTDEDLEELVYLDQKFNEIAIPNTLEKFLINCMPFLYNLPTKFNKEMYQSIQRVNKWYDTQMGQKLKNYDNGDNISAMDEVIKEHRNPKPHKEISSGNVNAVARDLIGAGTITTYTALYAIIAQLTAHPDIQTKAQNVIYNAIGDRQVRVKDKQAMPYIDSMIMEVLRLISHVPLTAPHLAIRDTTLLGHKIPKDTILWGNLWNLHHDDKLWDDPWSFEPERFLDSDGKVVPTDHPLRKRLLPFGAGRRVCAGEVMARNRLFLFVVALLQRFTFKPESDSASVPCDPRKFEIGVVIGPSDYKVKTVSRKV